MKEMKSHNVYLNFKIDIFTFSKNFYSVAFENVFKKHKDFYGSSDQSH